MSVDNTGLLSLYSAIYVLCMFSTRFMELHIFSDGLKLFALLVFFVCNYMVWLAFYTPYSLCSPFCMHEYSPSKSDN